MKRTIEVEDGLQDWTDSAVEDVNRELTRYLEDNSPTRCPDLSDLDYSGAIHEIIDSACPVYYSEIDSAHFLYGDELQRAYKNAGIGDGLEDNWKVCAIYCYIEERVNEWWRINAEEIFNEWEERMETDAAKLAEDGADEDEYDTTEEPLEVE